METTIFFTTFLLSSVVLTVIWRRMKSKSASLRMPPSLPSLPLVGSLPFISGFDHPGKFFLEKSKQLGPIFTFNIGRKLCVVLNTAEVIREALVKNNLTFAGREGMNIDILEVNRNRKGIGMMNFDATFKRYHQLSLSILKEYGFGNKRLMESNILREVENLICFTKTKTNKAFEPKEMMPLATSNIILNIIFGIRDDYESGMGEIASLSQKSMEIADTIFDIAPVLRFFPHFRQKFHQYGDVATKLINAIDKRIQGMEENCDECFVTRYIEKEGPDYDHEQLVFIIRDFINGGVSTAAATLRWTFIFLANYSSVQKRLQDEIDANIPRNRLPNLDDKPNLPYVEATILEIMRLRTIAPLAIPHLTLNDSNIGGYFIPEGAIVLPNIYAVHMNPDKWNEPEAFRPERFLSNTVEIIDKEKVMAFSLGRRSCPGEELARQELFLFLTGLYQNFHILRPEDQQWIDETEVFGLVVEPRDFKIRMIPRD